eukprot:scaffold241581_cov28-Tisochrysis_lutea.AAC.5
MPCLYQVSGKVRVCFVVEVALEHGAVRRCGRWRQHRREAEKFVTVSAETLEQANLQQGDGGSTNSSLARDVKPGSLANDMAVSSFRTRHVVAGWHGWLSSHTATAETASGTAVAGVPWRCSRSGGKVHRRPTCTKCMSLVAKFFSLTPQPPVMHPSVGWIHSCVSTSLGAVTKRIARPV